MADFDAFLELQEADATTSATRVPVTAAPKSPTRSSTTATSWSSTELGMLNELESAIQAGPTRGFSVQESSVVSFSEPVEYPHRHPDYENWASFQRHFLSSFVNSRGKQQRDYLMGSICTGAAPEKINPKVFPKRARHVMACEHWPPAVQFMKCNDLGFPTEHMFCCLKLLGELLECHCLPHSGNCKVADLPRLDAWIAGIACQPFSISSKDRMTSGSMSHPDVILIVHFVRLLLVLRPRAVLFENVLGFLKWDPSGQHLWIAS